ncbi:hypothetical protein SAMN05661008_00376 [Alkalithermobacter thermoalcaliphilus JW-YL-7 = DSM 7308]|uniref:Uncharacterized protein n=1 Tax=Alkalithermobacter thermoalcaliphilus JW-YL-7 = DSM 7308 TaxID=1121328 RepID=A0A150FPF2_CLOPD|nr:hypothetical protein JWYL7_0513 [[Clostridium] paradoxum JW-YL-7 = DSM 7308]SHK51682.1 hypothetical protein SAMN05661008_00376 [[Clostridium] paradoxum JW-YL-7 = DSM 7308]
MRKIFDEFMTFAIVFPIILLLLKAFLNDFITVSNKDLLLIFILALVNIAIRNYFTSLKEKYNLDNRNFEFIRRIIFILLIGVYLILR